MQCIENKRDMLIIQLRSTQTVKYKPHISVTLYAAVKCVVVVGKSVHNIRHELEYTLTYIYLTVSCSYAGLVLKCM